MKFISRTIALFFYVNTFFFSHSTFAYATFNYTSLNLPFIQGYLAGEPDDSVGSNEPPYPSFNVVFSSTTKNLENHFSTADLIIHLFPGNSYWLPDLSAADSNISLDQNGAVTAWNFNLSLTQTSPQTDAIPPSRVSWFVQSSYGNNTCNCDVFKYEDDIYTQRHDDWQYINTVGFLYRADNSPTNWSMDVAYTPEPSAVFLFLAGLLLISTTRINTIRC